MWANPRYLPEIVALAAVERLGATARRRVEWLARTYPDALPDAIARAVAKDFVRQARNRGIAAGLAGSFGLVVEVAGLNWLQAKLVLHLAAVYGHDPLDRHRAAELLVLQQVHGSIETAEAALAVADQQLLGRRNSRLGAPVGRMLGRGLLHAGAARIIRRLVPGAGVVVGAVTASRSTEMLAARATRYYRATPPK